MSRIHTITYEQAKKWYDSGRKYKPIGTKLTKNIWLNYDETNDCFTFSFVWSKYYDVMTTITMPDGSTKEQKQMKKAGSGERDKYTMKAIAYVHKDHAHIFHPGQLNVSNATARNFFEAYFNCTYRKSPGVKIKGFEWTFFREGLDYWQRTHGEGEVETSGAGLRIYLDGRREATEPVMVRVHKKEQQNTMNRHIKAVRRMLTLRAKLGGFNSVDWREVSKDMQNHYGHGRDVLRYKPDVVNKMFMDIDDEDYLTMLPVLWLAAVRNTSSYWNEPKWAEIGASYDWTGAFNRLVGSVREGLRNEQGAVEYVLDQPEE